MNLREPLSLLAVFLVLLGAPSPASGEDGRTLSEAQVACNRAQLEALVERISVTAPDGALSPVAHSLFVTYSSPFGSYEGLAVGLPLYRPSAEPPVPGFGPGPEHQLGFHLNPTVRELLLNPRRTPLDQISLTREMSTSSLVAPDSEFAIQVRLKPTLGPASAGGPSAPGDLVIDNLAEPPEGPGFRPTATKPGRGLTRAGLTGLCHSRFTEIDRKVFAILQRTLRVAGFDHLRGAYYDSRIALYRDTEPGVFGADVYLVDPTTGELIDGFLHLVIEAHADESGALRDGYLFIGSFDPPGEARLAGAVWIVQPLFGGVESEYEGVAGWPINSPLAAVPEMTFDWRDVLQETAWDQP